MSRKCWLPIFLALLVGCDSKPDAAPSPQTKAGMSEGAELEFVRALESEGQFNLVNHGSEPISFRSMNESANGFQSADARLECKTADSDQWEEGPRAMGDGDTRVVEVAPGSPETLIVEWEPGLADYYAGGQCRVDLRLQDGSVIESGEFSF